MKGALIRTNRFPRHITIILGMGVACALAQSVAAAPGRTTPAEKGRQFFGQTCSNCHGLNGQGVPNLGANLQTSSVVAKSSDSRLVALIADGIPATSPINKSHVPMPPKGANPSLTTQDIHEIVAYIRQLQKTNKGK